MKNKKGKFITFEGPEATGKSSQIILLKKFLKKNKIPYLITREPGGTKLSESLRKMILHYNTNLSNLEEVLLLMTARSNHLNNIIIPNIKKGKIVISDRFTDSTLVYQGYVNNFGINRCKFLHKILLNNYTPDLTFVFHLQVKKIIERLKKRKIKNKYDKIDYDFHNKVIDGYKKISTLKRYIHLDASLSKTFIHKKIIKSLNL